MNESAGSEWIQRVAFRSAKKRVFRGAKRDYSSERIDCEHWPIASSRLEIRVPLAVPVFFRTADRLLALTYPKVALNPRIKSSQSTRAAERRRYEVV